MLTIMILSGVVFIISAYSDGYQLGYLVIPLAWFALSGFKQIEIISAIKIIIVGLCAMAIVEIATLYYLGDKFISNMMLGAPTYRWDVLRAGFIFGSPLVLAPVAMLLLVAAQTLNLHWYYSILCFIIIILTGSRSVLLLSLVFWAAIRPYRRGWYLIILPLIYAVSSAYYDLLDIVILRGFEIFGGGIYSDESVIGREDTSLSTFIYLSENLPVTFFPTPADSGLISDSAIPSYWHNYGLLSLFILAYFMLLFSFRTQPRTYMSIVLLVCLFFMALSVGGAFSPPVLFLMAMLMSISHNKILAAGRAGNSKYRSLFRDSTEKVAAT